MQPIKRLAWLSHFAFLLLWLFAFNLGLAGIDFGNHWDEHKLVRSVRETFKTGQVLPGWYNYPSVSYDVMLLASLPEAATIFLGDSGILNQFVGEKHNVSSVLDVSTRLQEALRSRDFLPRARLFYLFITLLSGLWVYLIIKKISNNSLTALLAASLLYGSWEFAYHARWAAPDGLLAQFGLLTILLVIYAARANGIKQPAFLFLAAVAAGFTCSAKYFGGLFLIPVFIAGWQFAKAQHLNWKGKFFLLTALLAVFTASFLLSTPGALVDPLRFIKDVQFEMRHYSGSHNGYTVKPGLEHLGLILSYFALAAFSAWAPLAIAVFVAAVWGVYSYLRQPNRRLESAVLLVMPLAHLLYMSTQKVLFVRNYLVILPFLAIFAAIGIFNIWERIRLIKPRLAHLGLFTVWIALLAVNFGWQAQAALSIQQREDVDKTAQLMTYINQHPETKFYLSSAAYKLLNGQEVNLINITKNPQEADVYLYVSHEYKDALSNRFGRYQALFGPYEVNFNYYPSWDGDSRVVALSMQHAIEQKIIELK